MFPPIEPRHHAAVVETLLEHDCTVGEAVAECLKRGEWSESAAQAAAGYQLLVESLTSGDPGEISKCLQAIPGGPIECPPARIELFLEEAKTNVEDAVDRLLQQLFAPDEQTGQPSVSKLVELYTMQGAKGLTRRYVILPGCEELWLPRKAKGIDPEEEKRLFYVAITRAKERVLITHPWSRVGKGKTKDPLCMGKSTDREISPFVMNLGVPITRID